MLQIWGPAPGRAKRLQKAQPRKHRDVFLSLVFIFWPWWDIDPRCASYTCPSFRRWSKSSSNRTNEGFCSGRFLTKIACLSSSKLERRRHWVDCRHFRAKCVLFIAIARYLMTFCCSNIRVGASESSLFYRTTFESHRRNHLADLFCCTPRRQKAQKLSFTNASFTNDTATSLMHPWYPVGS